MHESSEVRHPLDASESWSESYEQNNMCHGVCSDSECLLKKRSEGITEQGKENAAVSDAISGPKKTQSEPITVTTVTLNPAQP